MIVNIIDVWCLWFDSNHEYLASVYRLFAVVGFDAVMDDYLVCYRWFYFNIWYTYIIFFYIIFNNLFCIAAMLFMS